MEIVSFNRIKHKYSYSLILLGRLIKTDFKLRYQGSVLGYLWSLLKPLALFSVLYFVFARFLRLGDAIPHFGIYLLVGIVLWNFFVELTSGAISSVVSKGDLIRKINFPKYVIVLASSMSAIINLGFNTIVIGIFILIFGADPSWQIIYVAPLILLEITLLGLGIGFFLSAIFVRYRDVGYIWEVVSQAMFYATPILYPIVIIPVLAQKILILNPMAQAIQDFRHYAVTPASLQIENILSSPFARLIPFLLTLFIFIFGALYFRSKSKFFAEEV